MKLNRLFLSLAILLTACGTVVATTPSPTASPLESALGAGSASEAPATSLYISATMHIESKFDSWPQDAEAFLSFLQQTTDVGMHWSIGGDVGWLEGDPRARDIVTRSAAMGVQWDVHAHKMEDLAKVASILASWGVAPTGVVSGMLISDLDSLRQSLTYQGYTWTPQVVWGGVQCPGHKIGCDDFSVAVYRPVSSVQFYEHDSNGSLIKIGGGDHTLAGAEALATAIANGQYTFPVIGFTLMVEPETLRIAESATADVDAILAFVARINAYPFVRWGTIEQTAQAWAAAGSVPFMIEVP